MTQDGGDSWGVTVLPSSERGGAVVLSPLTAGRLCTSQCTATSPLQYLCSALRLSAQVPRQALVFMEQSAFASLFLLGGMGSQNPHADGKEQGDIPENLSLVLVNGRESVVHPAPLALCMCTLNLKAQSWNLVVSCGVAVSEAADVLFSPGLQPDVRASTIRVTSARVPPRSWRAPQRCWRGVG